MVISFDPQSVGDLSTAHIADACVRLDEPIRSAPRGIRPVIPGRSIAGPARPVKCYGSVDIFLEAIDHVRAGAVIVIDNGGRLDEGCIGDLTVLEAKNAGVIGALVWGCHRDTAELRRLDLPVFSYGAFPKGPTRDDPREPDALERAAFGNSIVSTEDFVFADDDGALFVRWDRLEPIIEAAAAIRERERNQAAKMTAGESLRVQLRFREYLERRAADHRYGFRAHLRSVGGAIEE